MSPIDFIHAKGFDNESYIPDQLLTRNSDLNVTERVDFPALAAMIARGTLLGKRNPSTVPSTGAADGDNTGNGTMTGVASGGPDLQEGTYRASARTSGATARFRIFAPDGSYVGEATTGTAFTSTHLNLTINDGSTNFAVGDVFTVETTGSVYVASVAGSVDGSQVPVAIAAKNIPVDAAAQTGLVYTAGEFNDRAMTFGEGHSADSVRAQLLARGIRLATAIESEGR